jgi:hypothetical protein
VTVQVVATSLANLQIKQLRNTPRKRFDAWLRDLKSNGCAALGYRLTGDILERLCVKHLSGSLRAVVAFETATRATVLIVSDHDDSDPGIDVYTQLYQLTGAKPPTGKRMKPPCCSVDDEPPMWGTEIDELMARAHDLVRPPRVRKAR